MRVALRRLPGAPIRHLGAVGMVMVLLVGTMSCRTTPRTQPTTTQEEGTAASNTTDVSVTSRTTSPVTTAASTTTTTTTTTTPTGPPPGCGPFVGEVFAAAADELRRLAGVTLDELVADERSADLSDQYYTRVDDVTAAAAAGGCTAAALARVALDRFTFLPANGPAAVAARSTLVDDLAWRVTRSIPGQGRDAVVSVRVPDLPGVDVGAIGSCAELGDARLGVLQTMLDALGEQTLDNYLADRVSRGSELQDQTAAGPGPAVRFVSAPIDALLRALADRAEAIGCTEEDVARAIIAGAGRLRPSNSAAAVFAADQLDLALLLLTGV